MKKILSTALLCLATILPALAQNDSASSIIIEETQQTYETIAKAVSAATNGQTISIYGEAAITSQLLITDKELTIQGASEDAKIIITSGNQMFKIQQSADAPATLALKNLEINANYKNQNLILLAAGSLNLENIVINGFQSTATNGIVRIYGKSYATLDNLTFVNCTTPEATPYDVVFATANGTLVIKGLCKYTINLNDKAAFITNGGISNDSKVNLYYNGNHPSDLPIIKNCDDIFMFNLNSDDKMLSPSENNLYAVNKANLLLINEVDGVKTGETYSSLGSSVADVTVSGATIAVIGHANLTSSMGFKGKTVEIRGISQDAVITLAVDKSIANAGSTNTHISLRDLTITPQAGLSYTSYIAQATTNNSSVSFQNITFKDCSTTIGALIRANAGGVWHFDGVSFDNCYVIPTSKASEEDATPLVITNNAGCSVSGINNGLSILVNSAGTNSIDAEGLEAGSEPIMLTLKSAIHDHTLITNCEDPSLFEITNPGWTFQEDENGGLKTLDRQTVTGVEEVAAEADGVAEYFDLSGQRVSANALSAGIYVCRKGGKTTKIAIR